MNTQQMETPEMEIPQMEIPNIETPHDINQNKIPPNQIDISQTESPKSPEQSQQTQQPRDEFQIPLPPQQIGSENNQVTSNCPDIMPPIHVNPQKKLELDQQIAEIQRRKWFDNLYFRELGTDSRYDPNMTMLLACDQSEKIIYLMSFLEKNHSTMDFHQMMMYQHTIEQTSVYLSSIIKFIEKYYVHNPTIQFYEGSNKHIYLLVKYIVDSYMIWHRLSRTFRGDLLNINTILNISKRNYHSITNLNKISRERQDDLAPGRKKSKEEKLIDKLLKTRELAENLSFTYQ